MTDTHHGKTTTESKIYAFVANRKVFIRAISVHDAEDLYLDVCKNYGKPFEAVAASVADIQRMNALGLKPYVTKLAKEAARRRVKAVKNVR